MTVTLDLPPELEEQVRAEATRRGIAPTDVIIGALREVLRKGPPAPRLSRAESELLQRINAGPPEDTWREYHGLLAGRRSGKLTAREQARLVELSDEIEAANVPRIAALIELARLRGTTLDELMGTLDIRPRPHE